jgi:hypothetical protein
VLYARVSRGRVHIPQLSAIPTACNTRTYAGMNDISKAMELSE